MCAKPPHVGGRPGTWTTVGMRGRVGWAKAIAMGTSECQSGLQCGRNVGATYGFPAAYDVCEAVSRGGQTGHVDYCRDEGPCGVGEGDCDSTSECQSGLQCGRNVGATYGFPAAYDVCEAVSRGGQTGHVDYCRDEGPCGVGQGDCDGHSECQSGLQCRQDVGPLRVPAELRCVRSRPRRPGRPGTWTTVGMRAVWGGRRRLRSDQRM